MSVAELALDPFSVVCCDFSAYSVVHGMGQCRYCMAQ